MSSDFRNLQVLATGSRRPTMTGPVAVGLERLVEQVGRLAIADDETLAAIAYCRNLLEHYRRSTAQREATRERTKSLRVSKPPALIEHNGESKGLKAWCKELNLSYAAIYERMRKGEAFADAIKPGDRRIARLKSL